MHCNVERLCWAEVFKSICCPGICCLLGRVERGVEGVLDIEESAPQKAQKEQHYLSGGSWRRIEVITVLCCSLGRSVLEPGMTDTP